MSGDRHDMSDAEWEILRSVLPQKHQGPRRVHDRRVMNGIFFVLRTGTPWRDRPERYSPNTTCFNRLQPVERERHLGVDHGAASRACGRRRRGRRRPARLGSPAHGGFVLGARVHRHGAPPQVGLSRGGRTTKVQLGLDGKEMARTMFLTPGQAADCRQAEALLAGLGRDETVIGDLACDTDAVLELIGEEVGATAVIPSRSSRKSPRALDRATYRERNLVEKVLRQDQGVPQGRHAPRQDGPQLPVRGASGGQPLPAPEAVPLVLAESLDCGRSGTLIWRNPTFASKRFLNPGTSVCKRVNDWSGVRQC